MTCHNSRRGLRNEDTFDDIVASGDIARAPHGSSQTDVLMGQNAFLVEAGVRGAHSFVEDTCVNCHMVATPPPDILSYNQGGTNHTFFAASTVCASCHSEIENSENLASAFEATSSVLKETIEAALLDLIGTVIDDGNTIDLNGEAVIVSSASIGNIEFGEFRGRQSITVTFNSGDAFGPIRLNDVAVIDDSDMVIGELYDFADARLIKAGWNWNLAHNDGSEGAHNPTFVFSFLDAAIDALERLATES